MCSALSVHSLGCFCCLGLSVARLWVAVVFGSFCSSSQVVCRADAFSCSSFFVRFVFFRLLVVHRAEPCRPYQSGGDPDWHPRAKRNFPFTRGRVSHIPPPYNVGAVFPQPPGPKSKTYPLIPVGYTPQHCMGGGGMNKSLEKWVA